MKTRRGVIRLPNALYRDLAELAARVSMRPSRNWRKRDRSGMETALR